MVAELTKWIGRLYEGEERRAAVAHATPFAIWIGLMLILPRVSSPAPWHYLIQTSFGALCLAAFRPWRWYSPPNKNNFLLAGLFGIAVFLIWILPEMDWGKKGFYPMFQEVYLRFGVLPLGKLPVDEKTSLYDPLTCGWTFSGIRLAGSGLVVPVMEEFFWRGFLYRWLFDRRFLKVDLGQFEWDAFLKMCILFGVEHKRWAVGTLAGACYGLLMIRTRDIWAVAFAHAVTNTALGVFVLSSGQFRFW
jgi:hypothetical protein